MTTTQITRSDLQAILTAADRDGDRAGLAAARLGQPADRFAGFDAAERAVRNVLEPGQWEHLDAAGRATAVTTYLDAYGTAYLDAYWEGPYAADG